MYTIRRNRPCIIGSSTTLVTLAPVLQLGWSTTFHQGSIKSALVADLPNDYHVTEGSDALDRTNGK